jgi:diaminohydroxyphosphoribosylaminopyrimidine deaminase/5-amino-6-(5-phosphoribosylamino)uracil reductase
MTEREHESGNTTRTNFSDFDRYCMKRALTLARRGMGKTSPNPMVGAVIARDGRITGEGWHRRYGGKHAEAEAMGSCLAAGENAKGGTLYCTLEPCCFTAPDKHQPPCAELVIKSGIRRAVIAGLDPFKRVNGAGAAMLREAGIIVETGLFAEAEAELNRGYYTFQQKGRPFVHLKIAQTLDGRIAATEGVPGDRWITDEAARKIVHRMRAEYDAVLVGRGTVLADDPELTVRLVRGRNPLRVILDSRLSLRDEAKVLRLPDRE